MSEQERPLKPQVEKPHMDFIHKLDKSAIWMVCGIILLFSMSIGAVLLAPLYVDQSWTTPSSPYQVQMYEVEDPNIYISSAAVGAGDLQYIHHLKEDYTLLAFKESDNLRLVASPDLEKYITRYQDPQLKLTSRLLLLRQPEAEAVQQAEQLRKGLQGIWEINHVNWQEHNFTKMNYQILELYDPQLKEAFAYYPSAIVLQNWVDQNFTILDETKKQPYHDDPGVVYVQNPQEYRIATVSFGTHQSWRYDPEGKPIRNLEELLQPSLGFRSRQDLIYLGEHIYAIEGCWYCHTDQTRTIIQDVVLNGSDSFPAPPSSPNEYIYQKITFPGTRRIGPDISRVGVKRPSRDWHKSHFWAPKTASAGSIMPAFQHFFDNDPRGTNKSTIGIPNCQFEAMFQYLMTKGTRITPPTQAWWLGKDPIKTKEIIEGQRVAK